MKLTNDNFEKGRRRNSANFFSASLFGDQGRFDPTRSCMSIRFYNVNEENKCYENSLNRFIK